MLFFGGDVRQKKISLNIICGTYGTHQADHYTPMCHLMPTAWLVLTPRNKQKTEEAETSYQLRG